ncbi:Non-specific serine/threonine protein kinase [Bertholletia excelsa]
MSILLIPLFLGFLSTSLACQGPSNFSFTSFNSSDCNSGGSLLCMGSVSVENGSLFLTKQLPGHADNSLIGRVLERKPLPAWPATICTTFTFRILKDNTSRGYGDGMAFVLAPDDSPSRNQSFGSYLGLLDQSNQGKVKQIAIEFDTYKNEWDIDANHIGIDTTSVVSVEYKSLNSTGIDLQSGQPITVRIEYDGWTKNLQIYVAHAGQPLVSFLNYTIKLKGRVPSSVYAGFTAATGTLGEFHEILDWNFTSYELPKISLGKKKNYAAMIAPPIIAGLLLLACLSYPFIRRYQRKKKERLAKKEEIKGLIAAANGPQLYSYGKIAKATGNFSRQNLLGVGGFGSVYKGLLSDPPKNIAVKLISTTSKGGEKDYLTEICTIGRLRHKNLLQLQGWCLHDDELLLIYDFMPNSSLDKFIGTGETCLNWPTRHKILLGLASALVYLHEECGNPVVHRDVKPNNVMLDSDFNAHLGDFGLARLLQNRASVTTMIAGTPGYLAPEVSYTGRATPESDAYSFGMVVLEVICGKRNKGMLEDESMVDNVWSLYEQGALLDCVDKKLEGKYDEVQVERTLMVGLACLQPDHMRRPRMRKVVQILRNPDESLMDLPETRPTEVHLSLNYVSSTSPSDFSCSNVQQQGPAVTGR